MLTTADNSATIFFVSQRPLQSLRIYEQRHVLIKVVEALDHVDAQLLGRLYLCVGDHKSRARHKVVIYGFVSRIVVLQAIGAAFVSGGLLELDLALEERL
jgi:hypothetical protein